MQNVGQKLSWSRNTFSETRVTALENNKTAQPPGKQLWKENDEESCYKIIFELNSANNISQKL